MNRETLPTRLAELLTEFRAALGSPDIVELCYHLDGDPGDGSGWSVGVCDTYACGDLESALRETLDRETA